MPLRGASPPKIALASPPHRTAMSPENRFLEGARSPRGRFRPGVSGNPGGKPRGEAEVRQAARAHTAAALEVLARALRSRQERVRLLAADLVLTRAYGRPGPEVDTEARALELRRAEAEARLVEARVREVEE